MTVNSTFARILNGWQGLGARRHANLIREEMEHFNADTCEAELGLKLVVSRYLVKIGCDTSDHRDLAREIIRDLLVSVGGEKWADIRNRLDDAGGDVGARVFPTSEQ